MHQIKILAAEAKSNTNNVALNKTDAIDIEKTI